MLSKINAWIVERLAKAGGASPIRVAIEPSGLRVHAGQDQRVVSWAAVRRVVAYTRSGGIGDSMCLALEIEDGGVLELDETMADWEQVAENLGTYVPLAMSQNQWRTRLLADPSKPVMLFEDAAGQSERSHS